MVEITAALHITNLQRADRMAMAFGLEARVPFLDVKSVTLGLGLPAEWKAHRNRPAKYLLRQAFSADLPEEITNRPKQKFSKGAGSSDVIAQAVEHEISTDEFHSERARLLYEWNYRLPNKESLYYYHILRHRYETEWPWYSYIAPASWLIKWDVVNARSQFNFSEWDQNTGNLLQMERAIQRGKMPPIQYTIFHPGAVLNAQQKQALIDALTASLK